MLPMFMQKPFDVQYFQHIQQIFGSSIIAHWPLLEASGATVATDIAISEHLANGGFETAGAGGADVWGSWTETAGDGALANETTIVHSGSDAAKITAGATANTKVAQTFATVAGENYELEFWTRGDGTNAGRYGVYDVTGSADIVAAVTTGVTGTTYTMVQVRFTTPARCVSVRPDLWCPATDTGIAYFDDVSVKGRQKHNGAYSNVTLAQAGIGDGRTSGSFNGTSSYVNVYSAGFVADFTPSELSITGWLKAAAGEWASATQRRIINIQTLTSLLTIRKSAANTLQSLYNGGGTTDSVTVGGQTSEDWIHFGLTVSVSADQFKFFLGGVQAGATQTGIGTCDGTLISTATVIGSANSETPANVWSGNLANLIVLNKAATPAEIAETARRSV